MSALLQQWLHCLKLYVQISLFVASPSQLPYSLACLVITLLAYVITGGILLREQRSLISIIVQITLEILILTAVSFIVLKFINKTGRLLQTLTALTGVNLVVSLVSIPIQLMLPEAQAEDQVNPVTLQLNLILLLWNLAVISLIFKRSFEINTVAAGFIAFNYFLLYELLFLNFF